MLAQLLATSLALAASMVEAAPIGQLTLQQEFNVRFDCPAPITTYICPPGVKTLPSPSGYLSCGLPEPFESHQTCLYKAYGNFELVNYKFDGSYDGEMGSDPDCERWSRAVTTCGPEGDVEESEETEASGLGGICEGEETEHSCPEGFSTESFSETDFSCNSPTNICYYYVDSGLLDLSDDGRIDTTNFRLEDYENGCPAFAKNSTTCSNVLSWVVSVV
ncbi:hypothetical protein BDY24DRAFT_389147 [Mrakia frigida]|uniref:uncharacterized protein n=1 Tax=Mrakia frigida TaxID=29902 RepID=UPI003FCC1978